MATDVSSIPFLKAKLPPVIVSLDSKGEYFQALEAADDTEDIDDLAKFLQKESFRAMEELLKYDPAGSPPRVLLKNTRARREALAKKFWERRANEPDS